MTTRRRRLPLAYKVIATVLRPLIAHLTRQRWHGAEHLPESEGFVVCPNHVSHLDVFAFSHFLYDHDHPPFFLAKHGVFRIPVVGRMIAAAEQIPVHRGSGDVVEVYRSARAAIADGKAVGVYPEGTLTRHPDLWPMRGKTGAARISLETGCPVVPVAQWGPQEILRPYARWPHLLPRKTMHVRAGAPVDLDDLRGRPITKSVLEEATERIMTAITRELEVLRGELAPAGRFDPHAHGLPPTGNFHGKRHTKKEGR